MPVGGFAADHDPDRRPADGAHRLDEKHRRDPGTPHGGQGPPPLGTKAKLYFPTVAREDAVVQETRGFLRKVFGGSVGLLVNTMAEREELSREEIDQLYEALRKLEEKGHD